MKKVLNKEIVEQAIADVKAAGDKPTIERIRKITGGSPKTIIAIKRLIDDNEHDNVLSSNDNEHDNKNDNALSLHDIKKLIDTSINQKFEQLKSELLDTIKKNDFDVNNSTPELVQEKQVDLIQKLTTDQSQQVLKNKNKFETIERLQAEIQRLEETNSVSTTRSTEAEKERNEALKKVITLASENTELRSKLEAVTATEPELNSSIIELENKPEIKFTLDEAQERFFELRKEFPDKKQKEYLRILDSEGYTNTEGNSVGAYNLNRWCKAHNKSL